MDNRTSVTEDTVLDVEASDIDCLYRIARRSNTFTRVVYVTIRNAEIIPANERTESFLILRNLRKLAHWFDQSWHTMKVSKAHHRICIELDRVLPHALPATMLLDDIPRYNLFSLELLGWSKHRTSRARVCGNHVFMKIAPFSYQLGYLQQEVATYQCLALSDNSPLVPKFLGYVYEETPDRVIGFLCQAISGRHPSLADYDNCMSALEKIHAKGIHHGDINRYNILITPTNEVVFIDFENSSSTTTSGMTDTEMAIRMEEEKHKLRSSLSNESNCGRPLDMSD